MIDNDDDIEEAQKLYKEIENLNKIKKEPNGK